MDSLGCAVFIGAILASMGSFVVQTFEILKHQKQADKKHVDSSSAVEKTRYLVIENSSMVLLIGDQIF